MFFFWSEYMSSHIWHHLKFPLQWGMGRGGVPQNGLKHVLVLEFLRSDDFGWGWVEKGGGGVCHV